eukprot:XP_001705944.1 Hypothetical protein GL50803_31570 [Giardia lamblia ATCC 50803]
MRFDFLIFAEIDMSISWKPSTTTRLPTMTLAISLAASWFGSFSLTLKVMNAICTGWYSKTCSMTLFVFRSMLRPALCVSSARLNHIVAAPDITEEHLQKPIKPSYGPCI